MVDGCARDVWARLRIISMHNADESRLLRTCIGSSFQSNPPFVAIGIEELVPGRHGCGDTGCSCGDAMAGETSISSTPTPIAR